MRNTLFILLATTILLIEFTSINCNKDNIIYTRYNRRRVSKIKSRKNVTEVREVFDTVLRPPAFSTTDLELDNFLKCDLKCQRRKLRKIRRTTTIATTTQAPHLSSPTTETTINISTQIVPTIPTNPYENKNPDYTNLLNWVGGPSITATKYSPQRNKNINIQIVEVKKEITTATNKDHDYNTDYYDADVDDDRNKQLTTTQKVQIYPQTEVIQTPEITNQSLHNLTTSSQDDYNPNLINTTNNTSTEQIPVNVNPILEQDSSNIDQHETTTIQIKLDDVTPVSIDNERGTAVTPTEFIFDDPAINSSLSIDNDLSVYPNKTNELISKVPTTATTVRTTTTEASSTTITETSTTSTITTTEAATTTQLNETKELNKNETPSTSTDTTTEDNTLPSTTLSSWYTVQKTFTEGNFDFNTTETSPSYDEDDDDYDYDPVYDEEEGGGEDDIDKPEGELEYDEEQNVEEQDGEELENEKQDGEEANDKPILNDF